MHFALNRIIQRITLQGFVFHYFKRSELPPLRFFRSFKKGFCNSIVYSHCHFARTMYYPSFCFAFTQVLLQCRLNAHVKILSFNRFRDFSVNSCFYSIFCYTNRIFDCISSASAVRNYCNSLNA